MPPSWSYLNGDDLLLILILMFCTLIGLLLVMAMTPGSLAMSLPERVATPPRVEPLVVKVQAYRNAGELLDVATQRLMQALREAEITDDILAWAQTATERNATSDEYYVARWLLARERGRAQEQAHGHPC